MKKRIIVMLIACLLFSAAISLPSIALGKYNDVKKGAWYSQAVEYVTDRGLMSGTSDSIFSPNTPMSRAMLVTVLWRLEGSLDGFRHHFRDGGENDWYTMAIGWAEENGIVSGVGNYSFNPNANITREQLATIMYRYTQYCGVQELGGKALTGFSDASKVSSWASIAMKWAVNESLIQGIVKENSLILNPAGNATRAEVATVLMRYCRNEKFNHIWDEGIQTGVSTCSQNAQIEFHCHHCGITKITTLSKTQHVIDSLNLLEIQYETCTTDGFITFYCEKCKSNITQVVFATGHYWAKATCTKPKTCMYCTMTSGKALGHNYDAGKIKVAATCIKTGAKVYTCSRCSITKSETIKALGHKYDAGKVTKAATCTVAGVKTISCTRCAEKKTETIKALGHNYVEKVTKAATCTSTGTKTLACSRCNATKTSMINPTKHTFVNDYCTKCGAYVKNVTIILRTQLPYELSYHNYSDVLESKVMLTDFSYTQEYYKYDDEVSVELYFGGTKTYDKKGSGQSSSAKISWKLYDAEGYVVDADVCYSTSLAIGEKFRNAHDYVSDLKPGTYYLDILSTNHE